MSAAPMPRSAAARATIALPLLLLAFVIAYGVFGVGRDTTPKIHSLRNPAACSECHAPDEPAARHTPEPALCVRCHAARGEHCAADTAPPDRACSHCHDPHGKIGEAFLLRR